MISINHKALDLKGLKLTAQRICDCNQDQSFGTVYNELVGARVAYLQKQDALVIMTAWKEIKRAARIKLTSTLRWKVKKGYSSQRNGAKVWRKDSEICKNCDKAAERIGSNDWTRYYCEDRLVSKAGTCPCFESKYKMKVA